MNLKYRLLIILGLVAASVWALFPRTVVERVTHVKILHRYEVRRDGLLLAEGHSTLACVDREGRPQALPDSLRGG